MSAAPIVIIITRPQKPKSVGDRLDQKEVSQIEVIVQENSTDYEILMAAAAQLENSQK